MSTKDPIGERIDRANELAKAFSKGLDEQFSGTPYGMHRPTREETLSFYALMMTQHPPMALEFPDGTIEVESPWVVCLRDGFVEGGKEAWKRIVVALEGANEA